MTQLHQWQPAQRRRRRMSTGAVVALMITFMLGVGAIAFTVTALIVSDTSTADSAARQTATPIDGTTEDANPFQAAIDGCSVTSKHFKVAADGSGMTMQIKNNADNPGTKGAPMDDMACVLIALDMPQSVAGRIDGTRAMDGEKTASWNEFQMSWTYHPENGLYIALELSR